MIVAHGNHVIPKLKCAMCKKAFHSECVNKWFKKGGEAGQDKSCPMCRQPFFGERGRRTGGRRWEQRWEEEEEEEDDDDEEGWF
jgi:hypothetical protein